MFDRIRLAAMHTYGALPVWARKLVVRGISPSFRVGAACIVLRPDGAILLVRHSYRRGWGLPGGLIRRGEEPDVAALRETKEEIGVDLVFDGERKIVIDVPNRRVDVVFPARVSPVSALQEPRPNPPEIIEVKWFDPDELPHLQEEAASALRDASRDRSQRRTGSSSESGEVAG